MAIWSIHKGFRAFRIHGDPLPVELRLDVNLSRGRLHMELPQSYRPTEDEPYMNPRQLAYFRKVLLEWRRDLLQGSEETVKKLMEGRDNNPEPIDRGAEESAMNFELRTRDRQRKLIKKIDSALERINDGSYGYCDETGDEIGIGRLLARPVATLCLEAQRRHEVREKERKLRA